MDGMLLVESLLGSNFNVVTLHKNLVKYVNEDFEIFFKKNTVVCIVDKRNGSMKKVYKEAKQMAELYHIT